jgi:hypothetical protein
MLGGICDGSMFAENVHLGGDSAGGRRPSDIQFLAHG